MIEKKSTQNYTELGVTCIKNKKLKKSFKKAALYLPYLLCYIKQLFIWPCFPFSHVHDLAALGFQANTKSQILQTIS